MITQRVAVEEVEEVEEVEGRWENVASTWVEGDMNMADGEAMQRRQQPKVVKNVRSIRGMPGKGLQIGEPPDGRYGDRSSGNDCRESHSSYQTRFVYAYEQCDKRVRRFDRTGCDRANDCGNPASLR